MDPPNQTDSQPGLLIERIASPAALEPHLASLRRLLQRCVNDDPASSSIGFLAPLSDEAAIRYWLDLLPSIASSPATSSSPTVLLLATHADVPGVLATVQLALPGLLPDRATHSHRGEVRKLLVHPTYRRHGFGRLMMAELERLARDELGLGVLTLDTARDAPAREFYRRAGWAEFGVARDYARWADGRRHASSFFIKSVGEKMEKEEEEEEEENGKEEEKGERAGDPEGGDP